jgi:hypothetical protein
MGESTNARKAMDEVAGRLISEGVRPERATEMARESAIRIDIRDQGGKPPPRRPDAGSSRR